MNTAEVQNNTVEENENAADVQEKTAEVKVNPVEVKERKKRKIDEIKDPVKIFTLIRNHLAGQPLLIKGDTSGINVEIAKIDTKNHLILLELSQKVDLPKKIKIYKVLGRYLELEGEVVGIKGDTLRILRIQAARIATYARAHKRYPVLKGFAFVSNIRTSKNVIAASEYNIPTTVKVNFTQTEMQLRKQKFADIIKINTFDNVNEEKFYEIKKTGKSLMLKDTQDIESYIPENEDFINYQEILGIDVGDTIDKYRKDKIVSEIIIPVTYIEISHQAPLPLGFIQVQSKSEYFDQFNYLELKEIAFSLVDKIRDSNTITIKERQDVLDISEGGLKVRINHPELIQYLVHQAFFTFDVIFKMQQPLTFSARICTTYRDTNGDLILGIQIKGASSRKGELKRYIHYVRTLVSKEG
jgi:hypothetical protein